MIKAGQELLYLLHSLVNLLGGLNQPKNLLRRHQVNHGTDLHSQIMVKTFYRPLVKSV